MSLINQIFLTGIVTAFIFFGLALFSTHLWVSLPAAAPRQPAKRLPLIGMVVVLMVAACAIASVMVAGIPHP